MKHFSATTSAASGQGGSTPRTLRLRLGPLVALLVLAVSGTAVATVQGDAAAATTTTYTLFGSTPPKTGPDSERAYVELGTVFSSSKPGTANAIRFYKHSADTGAHYGRLWDSSGRLLASALFRNETTSGWQTVTLGTPITILAGRNYVVSHTTHGGYAADPTYFSAGSKRSGPLVAKKGVYRYGGGFPSQIWRSANYFSDVSIAVTVETPPPTTTSTTTTTPGTTSTTTTATTTTTPPNTTYPVLASYNRFANGPRYATSEFPYAVWLQDPTRARDTTAQWKALGVNTYVGIWFWPTDAGAYPGHLQAVLDAFAAAGAQSFAGYTGASSLAALKLRNASTVRGYLLRDEPDMDGTTAAQLAADAAAARAADPSRPNYVNFSKGIVNGWNNGVSVSDADKRAFCASADIASVDFYGFTDPWEDRPGATGYARAMDAMRAACGTKPIWAFVETTRPFDAARITADQFEVAVWTLLASGADGIELFVHDFGPNGMGEDALLRDPAAAAVKTRVGVVGSQIRAVAPLLHQADKPVASTSTDVRALGKQGGIVAVNMSTAARTATFTTSCLPGSTVRVVPENRTVTVDSSGRFTDSFAPYQHRVYSGSC